MHIQDGIPIITIFAKDSKCLFDNQNNFMFGRKRVSDYTYMLLNHSHVSSEIFLAEYFLEFCSFL